MMNVDIQVENHFITPIVVANFKGLESLNSQLKELFLAFEKDPKSHKNPHQFNTNLGQLFDSHFDLFTYKQKPIQEIKKIIEDSLRGWIQNCSNIDATSIKNMQLQSHAWFHIMHKGGQKTLHNHPSASWSVVYYVDEGEQDLDNRSGVIQFYDPRMAASMHQDAANVHLKREYNFNGVGYLPKAGMLLMFPSYLYHEVLPYIGNKPRINIAANYWVK